MGSLRKRLEKLEKLEVRTPQRGSGGTPSSLDRYFEEVENARRGKLGLAPLEVAPYGPEDAEDDRAILRKLDGEWPGNEGMRQVLEEEAHARLSNYYYAKEGDR
jgi:hypothetical protein